MNYQLELEKTLAGLQGTPRLLLHSCCGPCSSYVLEYLSRYFAITVFYYNPNIYPPEEYEHRVKEQQRFIAECTFDHPVQFVAGDYEPERFYDAVRTLEDCPEGGERCFVCYRLRLAEAAKLAKELYAPVVRPIDDQRSTAAYRKQVCLNLLADFLEQAAGR